MQHLRIEFCSLHLCRSREVWSNHNNHSPEWFLFQSPIYRNPSIWTQNLCSLLHFYSSCMRCVCESMKCRYTTRLCSASTHPLMCLFVCAWINAYLIEGNKTVSLWLPLHHRHTPHHHGICFAKIKINRRRDERMVDMACGSDVYWQQTIKTYFCVHLVDFGTLTWWCFPYSPSLWHDRSIVSFSSLSNFEFHHLCCIVWVNRGGFYYAHKHLPYEYGHGHVGI